jgi:diadenosine tetraphosphate (Ap4A) HIT family hydrolase
MSGTPEPCPLCQPRPDDSDHWILVAKLSVSTLYLDRNQTYRGHCQLIYDGGHVEGLEHLSRDDFARVADDLHHAARAISHACLPDHMNYASLGNVVPHLHWHLVPRYKSDPRWGAPIYTSDLAEMPVTRLSNGQYRDLAQEIHRQVMTGMSPAPR